MKRIAVLPPDISQKIAAGEVIERPVSVVKELVENSLDAGATEISIELFAGGKKLIKVQDNGHGMSREDAEICFVRHSTSKISREEDLSRIATLGFRGEALPSISAVSRLTLRTSEGSGGPGILIEREGDEISAMREIAFPRGTTVEVRDLFYNLPARLKFLRSDQSELGLIVKYATNVGLAYPQIRLSLIHGKRDLLNCPPVGSLKERIFQLYGKSELEKLLEIDFVGNAGRISGFASRPPHGRPDKSHQLFFVNLRPVRDRILQSALNQAFKGFLEKDLSPEAFLFLTLPYEDVDVNVHPAKSEVRFRDSQAVFQLVRRGVEHARLKVVGIKEVGPAPDEGRTEGQFDEMRSFPFFTIAEDRKLFGQAGLGVSPTGPEKPSRRVLGQYLNSYIVVEDDEELLVIDQHNAHERILFEKYMEIDLRKTWPLKMSLIPLLFDLSASQSVSWEENRPELEAAGFRVDAMGGRSYALKEYPDIFKPEEALTAFLALLEEMKESKAQDKRQKMLATMACKTAIKAGQPLPKEKMEYLLQELFLVSNPSLCPHGRPIIVKISRAQIEKGLKR
jgi:DNA mismatch repair protein MutL